MALAADQGVAAASELVVWSLPVADIDRATTALGLAGVSTTVERVDDWNAARLNVAGKRRPGQELRAQPKRPLETRRSPLHRSSALAPL